MLQCEAFHQGLDCCKKYQFRGFSVYKGYKDTEQSMKVNKISGGKFIFLQIKFNSKILSQGLI